LFLLEGFVFYDVERLLTFLYAACSGRLAAVVEAKGLIEESLSSFWLASYASL